MTTWLITGCSTGLGRALAGEVLARGDRTDFAGRSLTQSRAPVDDYADTAGPRRIENDSAHGTQPGDPFRAIIAAVLSDAPSEVLVLGTDALEAYGSSLEQQLESLRHWLAALSESTDFPETLPRTRPDRGREGSDPDARGTSR